MHDRPDIQLLRDYAATGSEAAFRELVTRHTDFVFSAALRQVESPDLAADLAQSVFTDLARKARPVAEKMPLQSSLAGWLHRSTRYAALNHLRDTRRRQSNERQAMEQLLTNTGSAPDWELIRPVLDEALDSLADEDREALLLRYFKNQDFRAIGLALGTSDDTAQKRVTRAVDRLRDYFSQREVTIGASGLVIAISANAVQAAPAGLAATIATATLAGATVTTSTAAIATKTIAMTTLQKTLVVATISILAGAGIYEARQAAQLRDQLHALQLQQAPLASQTRQLQQERDDATNQLASLSQELARFKKTPAEVLKLRGEVGALKQENKMAGEKSAISKLTSDPATRIAMREQQKLGMRVLYTDFAKKLKLTPEVTGKLNDMLADNVMDNVDLITQTLHDGRSQTEVEQIFSAADKAFQNKIQSMLGDDALAQYQEYTRNLINTVSAAQFADGLTGDDTAKKAKQKQFEQAMQDATTAALKNAGLPADYQAIPMLNFANIASEDEATQSLDLLDNIYKTVGANSTSFLSAEELASLDTFRTNALNNSRMMLTMNRKLMAPISK